MFFEVAIRFPCVVRKTKYKRVNDGRGRHHKGEKNNQTLDLKVKRVKTIRRGGGETVGKVQRSLANLRGGDGAQL